MSWNYDLPDGTRTRAVSQGTRNVRFWHGPSALERAKKYADAAREGLNYEEVAVLEGTSNGVPMACVWIEEKENPRNRSCPTCKRRNVLTPKDVRLGYQCDACADKAEGFGGYDS